MPRYAAKSQIVIVPNFNRAASPSI